MESSRAWHLEKHSCRGFIQVLNNNCIRDFIFVVFFSIKLVANIQNGIRCFPTENRIFVPFRLPRIIWSIRDYSRNENKSARKTVSGVDCSEWGGGWTFFSNQFFCRFYCLFFSAKPSQMNRKSNGLLELVIIIQTV